jgi:hypothetical protein
MSIKRTLAVLAITSLIATSAYADRRTSLAGNQLIKDRDDTFMYPQLALSYRNTLSFDYGAADGQGNGLFIASINKKSVFGVALHRTDVTAPLSGAHMLSKDVERGMLFGAFSNIDSNTYGTGSTIADLFYAMKMGNNKLGFRLGFTGANTSASPDGKKFSGTDSFGTRLSAGYSMGRKTDLVFDLVMSNGALYAEDKNQREASVFGVHVGGRMYPVSKKKSGVKYGALFDIAYNSTSDTDLTGKDDPADVSDAFMLLAGYGPVYRNKAKTLTAAFHAHLGIMNTSSENTEVDDDLQSSMMVTFPGFNMALEYQMSEWLVFRSGMNYNYPLMVSNSGETKAESSSNGLDNNAAPTMGWNAGLGFIFGDLKIDGTLNHGFMTQGPNFISGYSGGLFGLVSATMKFGAKKGYTPASDAPVAAPAPEAQK